MCKSICYYSFGTITFFFVATTSPYLEKVKAVGNGNMRHGSAQKGPCFLLQIMKFSQDLHHQHDGRLYSVLQPTPVLAGYTMEYQTGYTKVSHKKLYYF